MAELDLTGESPTPAADPVITIKDEPEEAALVLKFGSKLHLLYFAEGPTGWVLPYFVLVLVLAAASAVLATWFLTPGATWAPVACAAAGTGGVVIFGGAALLYIWSRIKQQERSRKE